MPLRAFHGGKTCFDFAPGWLWQEFRQTPASPLATEGDTWLTRPLPTMCSYWA